VATVATGSAPRSMDISVDGQSLYVVNYESSTVSKVTTADMGEVQELSTAHHPIGISYDRGTGRVWVACYGGEIEIFDDR
jgi:DNA-binding beta-propeller fold protein YncE